MSHLVTLHAGNLKSGGAVQVAGSFFDEFAELYASHAKPVNWIDSARIVASDAVWSQISPASQSILEPLRLSRAQHLLSKPTAEFVVFGPTYEPSRACRTIMGFADVTILHPDESPILDSSLRARVKKKLRTPLAWASFDSADHLVVETEHVREALRERRGYSAAKVAVVANTINARFLAERKQISGIARQPGEVLFAYVTRAYPHKNIRFLSPFVKELAKLGVSARVVVTLTRQEWENLSSSDRTGLLNVGPVTIDEARSVYEQCDAVIFPSLLECFSASPLEALSIPRALYASDREFVRTICGDVPFYFDPLNPGDAARVFMRSQGEDPKPRMARGQRIVEALPTAKDRTLSYLSLIDSAINA